MRKRTWIMPLIFLLLLSVAGCGKEQTAPAQVEMSTKETQAETTETTEEQEVEEPASNILIAYFSLADIVPEGADAVTHATPAVGNTELAAMEIQSFVGGDLFAIHTVQDYPVSHSEGSAIAEQEMRADARPELSSHVEDMSQYDTVYLGYPIWWYIEPMAIRTFLEEYDFSGKTVIPFCTTLGAGIGESEENIAALAEGATVLEGLTLRTGRESNLEEISSWLEEIGMLKAQAETQAATDGQIPITLTIGETVLDAYLNDSPPAQSLASQLPLTVTLGDSDNDFCGGSLDLSYTEEDVTSGYENGDLAFWTPANNFVIFVSGEETSEATGNLVKLGRVTSPQEMLDALEGSIDVTIALKTEEIQEGAETMQVKITVGDRELYAQFEDNATSRALMEQMPMTLSMSDLYGREMCYRYGAGALPTDELRSDGYEIGDIAYWPPRGSLVILYAQNGEQFERQQIGHIDSGVEIFEETGDVDVRFELIS